jgi:hypothetical protein
LVRDSVETKKEDDVLVAVPKPAATVVLIDNFDKGGNSDLEFI